jgi:hypothetical protein
MLVLHCMMVVNVGTWESELGFELHLARQIGVDQIGDHRTPDPEINRAVRSFRHRLYDRHRQEQ